MRQTPRHPAHRLLRRTLPVLAMLGVGVAIGRATALTSVQPPAPPAAAPLPPNLPALPGHVVSVSDCDAHHAAERAWRGRDPIAAPVLYRVRVLRVVDGDTIRVRWHGEDVAVRLLRIDTPEVGQPGYREAAARLTELIAGDWIDLEFEGRTPARDRYGRLLAYLRKGGRNLNVEMIHTGHAIFYDRFGAGKYAPAFTVPPDAP